MTRNRFIALALSILLTVTFLTAEFITGDGLIPGLLFLLIALRIILIKDGDND